MNNSNDDLFSALRDFSRMCMASSEPEMQQTGNQLRTELEKIAMARAALNTPNLVDAAKVIAAEEQRLKNYEKMLASAKAVKKTKSL